MRRNRNIRISRETRALLAEKFPHCFVPEFKAPKRPLKIGIAQDIHARLPGVPQGHVATALFSYTDGPTYLNSLVTGAERLDLDGKVCGTVTAEEAAHAAWRSLGVSETRRINRELKQLRRVERAARWLVAEGLCTTPEGLIVIEKSDNSDPHYELCVALDALAPLNPEAK
jgi:sRNA-binding protein